jgi:signal transduction histidine kinase
LFIILSLFVGAVLALQFYFFNRAHQQMLEEVSRLTQAFNMATDSYFLEVAGKLPNLIQNRSRTVPKKPPVDFAWPDTHPLKEEFDNLLNRNGPPARTRKGGIALPKKPLLNDQKIALIWHQLKGINGKVILNSDEWEEALIPNIENFEKNIEFRIEKYESEEELSTGNFSKSVKVMPDTESDSIGTVVQKIDIDLVSTPDYSHPQLGDNFKKGDLGKSTIFTLQIPDFSLPDGPRLIRYNFSSAQIEQTLLLTRNRNFFITILLYLLSIGVILFLSHRFLRPVGSLKTSFENVVNGDLEVIVPEETRDEIGDLTRSFNHMVKELKKNREKEIFLQRKERLASVGQLAAGVAHEIKNPLNSINLTIEHLKDKFLDKKEIQVQKYIETIQHEIRRLDNIVNNFLSFVRIENLNKQDTDINELISGVMYLFAREMEVQKIVFKPDFESPFVLAVDSERIKTVLVNIILNGIQAMPDGGNLIVKTRVKDRTITIIDSGMGIPENEVENIFDIFYTTKSSGTGLGMPTAYKIVKSHGGDIFIRSKMGEGTHVEIRF